MEEAISSAGKWSWLEIANDTIYLDFENVQLYNPTLTKEESHSSEITIRFNDNVFFTVFSNDKKNKDFNGIFLNSKEDLSYKITDRFKFQDFTCFKKLSKSFKYSENFIGDSFDEIQEKVDFVLCFNIDKLAIITGGNQIQFLNDFTYLSDEKIKKLSNKWWIYWVNYWKMKGTANEYSYDPACESIPFK